MPVPVPPPHQGEVAGIVTRGLAALVDVAVVGLGVAGIYLAWAGLVFAWSPLTFQWPRPGFGPLLLLGAGLAVGYQTSGWATTGRTYGTALLGLRVVARSGRHLRWSGALVRAALCTLVPIGLAWVVVSPRRRSLQDVLLGTAVVYDWTRARVHEAAGAAPPSS